MDPMRSKPPSLPFSLIGSACQALISSVGRTVTDVTNFIRRCRPARADLAALTRELSELQMVLELLNDHGQYSAGGDKRQDVPLELQSHLRPILTNCTTVVLRINGVLQRHGEGDGPPKWTPEGRKEVNVLQNSLEVHRGALGLVSDLISITIARAAKEAGAGDLQGEQPQVHEVVEGLQAVMSSILISDSNATLARQHFALQVHLGQIIAYAQTLNRTDAWEEAVKTIDATQGKTAVPEEPVSTIASRRARWLQHRDGGGGKPDVPDMRPRSVSPVEPNEAVSGERKDNSAPVAIPKKDTRKAPHLTIRDLASTTKIPIKDPESVSPMTYQDLTATRQTVENLNSAGEPISPMTFGKPTPVETTEEYFTTIHNPARAPMKAGLDEEAGPGALLMPTPTRPQIGVPASRASTAESAYEDEEITEEALAFAQVPVHIMGRLSVNLVGHLYTNKSGLSGGSDETSFNKSISTVAAAEDTGEADGGAEGYAHSTATSDTGSLRDGHLQFSQMDVTQVPAQESRSTEESPVQQQAADSSSQANNQMSYQRPSHEIHEQQSVSTMNTQNFLQGKPLPRPPLVYIPTYPGPFTRKKVVVVGNLSCGKTCLIT